MYVLLEATHRPADTSIQLVCSRFDFHFSKQDLEYLDSREEVDIAEWEAKFRHAANKMYFV
jgi:hypothetical protein